MNQPQRYFIQEVDHIRIALAANDNRARREGWQLIAAIAVMGVLGIAGYLGRLI